MTSHFNELFARLKSDEKKASNILYTCIYKFNKYSLIVPFSELKYEALISKLINQLILMYISMSLVLKGEDIKFLWHF